MAKKHHEYSHTTVRHHSDGSHTITHHHHSGEPHKHKEYAVLDHDGMMDGMHENLSPEMAGAGGAEEEGLAAGAAGEARAA